MRDEFESLSPVDYRYWDKEAAAYLSENAFTRAKLEVELALVRTLCRRDLCPSPVLTEIMNACDKVTTADVYEEEKRIGHDIRALVNCIRKHVSAEAKPFVHLTATSYDIVDTANASRYRKVVQDVLLPSLVALENVLIELALREAETAQVGRTHGQHAVPITFGFAIAGYVSRLGGCIVQLVALSKALTGKFSGAVGAYNASSLFVKDPEEFESAVLGEVGVHPAEHSTQIVPPEALVRLLSEMIVAGGVMANLADDMRHLQRSEIDEVRESFGKEQVGSSTMPQKRNPISFEQVKSLWKIGVARMQTVYMDQLSEHQRDLTNSASSRTYGEIIIYAVVMAKRLAKAMKGLSVQRENVERNMAMSQGMIVAEPLHLILASLGHPNSHEKVLALTRKAQDERRPLEHVAADDAELESYYDRMPEEQRQVLLDPSRYIGIAAKKARTVATRWQQTLAIMKFH